MKDRYFLDIYHTFTGNYIISQLYYIGSWDMIDVFLRLPLVSTGVTWSKFDRLIVAQDAMALQGNHLTQLLHHCFMNKRDFSKHLARDNGTRRTVSVILSLPNVLLRTWYFSKPSKFWRTIQFGGWWSMWFVHPLITKNHQFSTWFSSFPPLWTMQKHLDLGRVSAHRVSEQLEKAKGKYTVSLFRKMLSRQNIREPR